ncbi:transporter [Flavobacterium sp.]|uniref:transporter n=1 Tax=Flavobacterium sp. TaxID=239 RepID=UPI00286AB48D|nr:transporter [Flavobacterium sp.]
MKKTFISCLILTTTILYSQTEVDGLMMPKKNICLGGIFQNSSWSNYWEGTFKRDNLNFGTVTTNTIAFNANYGITDKINIIAGLPYIQTKVSGGTLIGQSGFQDISFTLKYNVLEKKVNKTTFSLIALAGFSIPTTDYVADYLPLSIGLQSKTTTFRLMGDYQIGKIFATLSAAYVARANIIIDRDAYFTTEYIYSNEVAMPDVYTNNLRMGYRSEELIAELIYDNWLTLGGFDITKNNMPFPSNMMNMSKIGFHGKYTFKKLRGLALLGGYNYVIDGRNVGQSQSFYGGLFYTINFTKL